MPQREFLAIKNVTEAKDKELVVISQFEFGEFDTSNYLDSLDNKDKALSQIKKPLPKTAKMIIDRFKVLAKMQCFCR